MKNITAILQVSARKNLQFSMLFFLLFIGNLAFCQLPTGIIWDSAVGCEEKINEFNFDVENPEECVKVCQGSKVTYTIVGGDSQYWIDVQWYVNGGSIQNSSNQDISINWGSQTAGEIILKIETLEGIFTRKLCIELLPKPLVDFTIYPYGPDPQIIEVCKNEIVYFENLSHSNGGSQLVFHNWSFSDDGTTSAEFEPSHVFQQSGVYYVELIVTNACNCTTKGKVEVHVLEEGLQIECNSIVCEDEVDTYTVSNLNGEPIDCGEYEWIIEGGDIVSQNSSGVKVTWNQVDEDGFGYVTYNPENCNVECALPVSIKVPVIINNAKITGSPTLCEGEQFRYSIPQWPSTEVEWKITPATGVIILPSDQPNEVVLTGNAPGAYLIEAIYNNTLKACGGVAFKEITISPSIEIIGPITVCEGETHTYTSSSGTHYNWEVQGPSDANTNTYSGDDIDVAFNEPGLYTIHLIDMPCVKPSAFTVLAKPLPEAPESIDGPVEVCPGVPVTYTVSPMTLGSDIAVWNVDNGLFADNLSQEATGNEVTVIWSPNTSIPYQLSVAFIRESCRSTPISISPVPLQVDYTFAGLQTVCASSYQDYSVDYLEGDKYEWKIITPELGSIAEYPQDHEVEVLWNNVTAPTVATIELSIEKCGSRHVKQYDVTINPSASIGIVAPSTVCRDEPVSFGITGLSSHAGITWDFGDGNQSSSLNPTHTYTALNTNNVNYPITVTVTSPNGCTNPATATINIEVQPAPVAYISPAQNYYFCDAAKLAANQPLLALVIDNNYGAASQIKWFHNNNWISSLPPLAMSYTATQFGEYYAEVISANGCSTRTSKIKVIDDDCGGSGPGDTCIINQAFPLITSVTNTQCNKVTVQATPNGSVTPNTYAWSLDGIALTGQSMNTAVVDVFGVGLHAIKYAVEYTSTEDNGNPCDFVLSHTESILVPYEADLKYSITCSGSGTGYEVTLYDASNFFAATPIQNIKYYVDNVHQPASNDQPQHVESNLPPGNHTLKLEISGSGYPACSISVPITLPDLPTASINAPTQACAGEPVQFSAIVNDPNVTYLWDFDDVATNSLPNPIRNFDNSQSSYDVELTITNQYGCSTTTTMNPGITIKAPDMTGRLSLNPPTTCYGNPITITYDPNSQPNNIIDYTWSREVNGVVLSSTQTTTPSETVTESGIYVLDGEDINGCIQYGIARISVSFLETPAASITGPIEVCEGEAFSLEAHPQDENNYQYTWTLNGQAFPQWDDKAVITPQLNTPGVYSYEVVITTPAGCSDTASFNGEVFSLPNSPAVSMDIAECDPYSVNLSATVNEPGTYVWSDGQSGSDISVTHGGPYSVTFINNQGCASSTEIDVPQNPEAYIWAYPQGCYELCETNINELYVTGPSIPFNWEWQINTNSVQTGSGVMPNEHWAGDGLYQLQLANGYCAVTSPGFSWELAEGCRECEISIEVGDIHPMTDINNNCYFLIDIALINNGPPLSYTLNNLSNTGVMILGAGFLPNGTTSTMLEFYPPNNFTGGIVDFQFIGSGLDEPFACLNEFFVNLPSCPQGSAKSMSSMGLETLGKYTLVPNPTLGSIQLTYPIEGSDLGAQILYVYDLYGREIKREKLNPAIGKTSLDLAGFANGTYLLMLRKNEKTVFYQRVILNK